MKKSRPRRKLLLTVVAAALALHVGAIYWLHNYPLKRGGFSLRTSIFLSQTERDMEAILERQKRTEELAETFQNIAIAPALSKKEELSDLSTLTAPSAPLALPLPVKFADWEGELALPKIEFSAEAFILSGIEQREESYTSLRTSLCPAADDSAFLTSSPLLPPHASFDHSEDFDDSGSIAGSEHFNIVVEYVAKSARPGYVFKATFLPKNDVRFKRIRQNYYFLLDRSNSIDRNRYYKTRQAIAEALPHMQRGDTFNILVFDDKVVRLCATNFPWTEDNVAMARTFLETQSHGGLFAATDLYASLGKIIPQTVSPHEVHTAILLSDGDTFLPADKQRQTIGEWTKQNKNKVSLFCLPSGTRNNIPLLDLISSFNKGVTCHAQRHDDIGNTMLQLMASLRSPIGKNMSTTAVVKDKQMSVLLQPVNSRLPDLYQHRPFVVFGSVNTLGDFTLFLQGNYYDKKVDIKKTISFKDAKCGTLVLEKQWTQLLVQDFYERYFKDGKQEHLDKARRLLKPLNIPVPFSHR